MPGFDEVVADAMSAPIEGWDFGWLAGRAVEERPSWRYFDLVTSFIAESNRLLDIETGAANLLTDQPRLPPTTVATEAFLPSVAQAARALRARGATLVQTASADHRLPFTTGAFDLVVSRHPIETDWPETARVLAPGGRFVSQQVGPHSLRELTEFLIGPRPGGSKRDPEAARRAAGDAGLVVERLEYERPRTVFYDVGAVIYFLRVVVWIVPGFSVERYRSRLRELDEYIRAHGSFESTASRFLITASKPA